MPADVLNLRALNRALLARQHLLTPALLAAGPARAQAVLDMVEHLAGLQAQAPFPPYYGLWSRLAGFEPADLADLLVSRQVVRIALMRGTIHLVSARDCQLLRPLIQPVLDRNLPAILGRPLADVDTGALADAARELVARLLPEPPPVARDPGPALPRGLRPGQRRRRADLVRPDPAGRGNRPAPARPAHLPRRAGP